MRYKVQHNTKEKKTMMELKLKDVQMEEITVAYLGRVHNDLKNELYANEIECFTLDYADVCEVLRSVVAIETVLKDLMYAEDYFVWKLENGVEL